MAHDLIFAACVDWLTPREYDGRALLRLPADDPRRRVDRALAAEIRTAVGLLERLADVFLVPLKEYLSKSAHRDKLGLFVQRAVLVPVGLLPRGPVADTFSRLGNAIADSRRANKWLAGVGPLLELRASSALHKDPEWTNWALRIGAEVALFSSILAEHLRWLRQHRIVSGPPGPMARRTNRLLAARSACLLALLLRKALRTRAGLRLRRNAAVVFGLETASGAVSDGVSATDGGLVGEMAAGGGRVAGEGSSCTEGGDTGSTLVLGAEERALLRASVLEAMRLAQAAHMGHLFPTHDALVGIMGVITASHDIRAQWRTSTAPKAKAA